MYIAKCDNCGNIVDVEDSICVFNVTKYTKSLLLPRRRHGHNVAVTDEHYCSMHCLQVSISEWFDSTLKSDLLED